jgi:hypothetical protein
MRRPPSTSPSHGQQENDSLGPSSPHPPQPPIFKSYLTAQTSKSGHPLSVRRIHPPSRKNILQGSKTINPIHPHRIPFRRPIPHTPHLHHHPPFLRPHIPLPPPRRMGRKITKTNPLMLAPPPHDTEFHPLRPKINVLLRSTRRPCDRRSCTLCTAIAADVPRRGRGGGGGVGGFGGGV